MFCGAFAAVLFSYLSLVSFSCVEGSVSSYYYHIRVIQNEPDLLGNHQYSLLLSCINMSSFDCLFVASVVDEY